MRKLLLLIFFTACSILPAIALSLDALPNYQDAGMKFYVRGTQKLQEKDYIGASEDLRQAVRARPDMAEAFHNLGFALEKTGDLRSAASAYEKALTINPSYSSALNNLGFLLANVPTEVQRAIQLCQKAVELEPNSPSFRDSLGWACYKAGRLDEATMNFKGALKLDPAFFKANFNLGLCEFVRKNYAEAGRQFATTIKMNPNFIKAYIPLAECYERTNQANKAVYVYQQALTKAPEGSPVKKHMERQLKRLNKDSKSHYFANVKQMRTSSKLNDFLQKKTKNGRIVGETTRNPDAFETSGTYTPVSAVIDPVARSDSGLGISDFDITPMPSVKNTNRGISSSQISSAMETFPSTGSDGNLSVNQERSLEKRYALCKSYMDKGLYTEAAQDLEKIVTIGGTSTVARQAKSLLLKVRKELEERDKESAMTHLSMGKDFFRSGKYDMAEAEFSKSLRLYPENAEAQKDLALLHYNQGRLKEAYEESKRAIALDRSLKEAYIVLGSLYSKKGRADDAVRTLKRIREISTRRDAVDELAERMINTLTSGT